MINGKCPSHGTQGNIAHKSACLATQAIRKVPVRPTNRHTQKGEALGQLNAARPNQDNNTHVQMKNGIGRKPQEYIIGPKSIGV